MRIVRLMNSPGGRIARGLAGAALIVAGGVTGGFGGLVLALVGLVPLAAGTRRCRPRPAGEGGSGGWSARSRPA